VEEKNRRNPEEKTPSPGELKPMVRLSAQLLILVLNYIPFFIIIATILLVVIPYSALWLRILAGSAFFLLGPPILARLLITIFRMDEGKIRVGSGQFFLWWTLLELQVIFCRFPSIEELLRSVPGVYSLWMRLWGAKIGKLTYWAAGTLILDRCFIEIGDNVIFGAGVRLNAHVLHRLESGELELLLGTIKIGDNACVGGYSLLTSGCEIAEGESTRAFLIMQPFDRWEGGQRLKPSLKDALDRTLTRENKP